MNSEPKIKVVGARKRAAEHMSPEECHRRHLRLQRRMELLNPFPRPRGFVYKAKTWEDYETWRKAQSNPRLW